jgi:type VI secretion system secreted protein VgrG
VQYRETDLDFVLRILADEGITVVFDHDSGIETVVLIDDNEALPNAGREPLEQDDRPPPRMPFVGKHVDALPLEGIAAVGRQSRLRRRQWSATAWDWQARPGARVSSDTRTDDPAAVGGWWEADEGRLDEAAAAEGMAEDRTGRRAQLQRLRDHATATRQRACSNAIGLRAGSVFELLEGPDDEFGDKWVATAIRHEGRSEGRHGPGSSAAEGTEGLRVLAGDPAAADAPSFAYRNDLECQPLRAPVVPPRSPRPRVMGVQTAVVTGPPGETIHTDRFGRVRVRMSWDEQEQEGEPSSCWLRVATPWAGEGFGSVFIPRVGTEVLVSFVDGDPDRPICSACVHDGTAMPPYRLPGHATRTVLRTRTVGGEGYSELSFEDAAGAEEVFLHAQRNLREQVLAHHSTEVGRNQTLVVDGSRHASIGKDDSTVTAGEHRHVVSGRTTARYLGGYALRVGEVSADADAPKTPTDMAIEVVAGGFELRSAQPIVLCCGDSRLELHPDRIVLRAPRIAAECPRTSLVLEQDAATLRASKKVELGADVFAAVGTSITAIKGSTCEIAGSRVGIEGQRVTIAAASRIDIVTAGEVDIRGTEKIKLN